MRTSINLRFTYCLLFLLACFALLASSIPAQEMGGDFGNTPVFRPKNPETKRRSGTTRPVIHRPGSTSPVSAANIEDKIDDALEAGNNARDARKYPEAELAYKSIFRLKARDPRAAYGLGNIYVDQQRWDDAENSYRQAFDSSSNDADILMALSFVLVQPRTGAGNARRLVDAETFARRATNIQPTNAMAFDRLGAALEARGILSNDTEQAYRRAVELDPKFAVAQIHLARLLRKVNRGAEAEPFYARAIEQAQDAPTLVLIAEALQSEQRWDNSEPVLRRALVMDARNPGALFLLGRMLTVRQRYPEAEGFLKSAIEVNPRSFQNYNILGRAYLGLQRYDDALKTYEQGLPFASPGDRKQMAGAFGFGGVAEGYVGGGRMRDAVRAYERALFLDPGNSDVQKKLAAARAKIG
ncbi:MAG: protein O-mannosyl-transferase [Blastocatellia bacterium]|nr:protein O-mannosyl-transferase [Blastocatellia bacterium]